jgi:hypothetical protein
MGVDWPVYRPSVWPTRCLMAWGWARTVRYSAQPYWYVKSPFYATNTRTTILGYTVCYQSSVYHNMYTTRQGASEDSEYQNSRAQTNEPEEV